MSKFKNPANISSEFNINQHDIDKSGFIDVFLNVDTKLFIDPLLLLQSKHIEISQNAVQTYRNYFELVIKLLAASKSRGDVPWRNAIRYFQFHEIS